jgi:hypothetical protein
MNATLMTRADYLADYCAAGEAGRMAAHRAYYAQFVTPAHFAKLSNLVGLIDRIKSSNDPHFNNIQLSTWDRMAVPVPAESAARMKECGDYPTLVGAVCILKEAAQQIREGSAKI